MVGACLALGAVAAIEARHMSVTHGLPLPWPTVLATTLPRWLMLAAVLPFVFRLGTRVTPPWLHLGVLLAISLPLAGVDAWATGFSSPVAHLFTWSARLTRAWYRNLPLLVPIYVAVVGAAWALTRTLRAAQLESQLQAARLAALRAQVQPHFLYNTLNGIAALVADAERDRALAAIEELSELLHASLRSDAREAVSVDEEVALARRYLSLQAMRFGDRLHYAVDISRDAAGCRVPAFLLQPVIENAVVHGLDAGAPALSLSVTARVRESRLTVTVENDGVGPELGGARSAGHGVGLAATRARLATGFGAAASLSLEPRPGGGAVVRIEMPALAAAT